MSHEHSQRFTLLSAALFSYSISLLPKQPAYLPFQEYNTDQEFGSESPRRHPGGSLEYAAPSPIFPFLGLLLLATAEGTDEQIGECYRCAVGPSHMIRIQQTNQYHNIQDSRLQTWSIFVNASIIGFRHIPREKLVKRARSIFVIN